MIDARLYTSVASGAASHLEDRSRKGIAGLSADPARSVQIDELLGPSRSSRVNHDSRFFGEYVYTAETTSAWLTLPKPEIAGQELTRQECKNGRSASPRSPDRLQARSHEKERMDAESWRCRNQHSGVCLVLFQQSSYYAGMQDNGGL